MHNSSDFDLPSVSEMLKDYFEVDKLSPLEEGEKNNLPGSQLDQLKLIEEKIPKSVQELVEVLYVEKPYAPGPWHSLTPDQRREAAAQFDHALLWWEATLDASFWWGRASVSPPQAALLLCELNPNNIGCDPLASKNEKTGPGDYKKLLIAFEELQSIEPAHRRLEDWLRYAQECSPALQHHFWIDWYAAVMAAAEDGRALQKESPQEGLKTEMAAAEESHAPQKESPQEGLKTDQIVAIFGSLIKIDLKSALDDGAKWVVHARVQRGTKGGRHRALWDPVSIASALHSQHKVSIKKLNGLFETELLLKPWDERWSSYAPT